MSVGTRSTVLVIAGEEPLVEQFATWLGRDFEVETATSLEGAREAVGSDTGVVLLDQSVADPKERPAFSDATPRVGVILSYEPDWNVIRKGYDGYLVKPISREDVISLVERLFARDEYLSELGEYYTLVADRAAMVAGPGGVTSEDADAADLDDRIDTYQDRLAGRLESFEREDFLVLFRDLDGRS